MIIETDRLILRRFTLEDAESALAMNSDPEVTRYLPMEKAITLESIRESIKKNTLADYEKHGFGRMAVTLKETGEFIGFNGLKYEKDFGGVDIGFRFLREHWGKGYATESAIPFIKIAFDVLDQPTIWGGAMPENTGSINVLTKLGLNYRKDLIIEGEHIGAMVNSMKMNRNALPSKQREKPDLDYSYKKYNLKFKEPSKADLDCILHKIRRRKNRENLLFKQFRLITFIVIGMVSIIYLFTG